MFRNLFNCSNPYRPEDAGLYINWALLTEEAKRLLYGK